MGNASDDTVVPEFRELGVGWKQKAPPKIRSRKDKVNFIFAKKKKISNVKKFSI